MVRGTGGTAIDLVLACQCHDASTHPGAGEPGPGRPGFARQGHKPIQFRTADLEIVTQALVGSVHESPEPGHATGVHRDLRPLHPHRFAHHMTEPLEQIPVEMVGGFPKGTNRFDDFEQVAIGKNSISPRRICFFRQSVCSIFFHLVGK